VHSHTPLGQEILGSEFSSSQGKTMINRRGLDPWLLCKWQPTAPLAAHEASSCLADDLTICCCILCTLLLLLLLLLPCAGSLFGGAASWPFGAYHVHAVAARGV
jgi:hypothetical protein